MICVRRRDLVLYGILALVAFAVLASTGTKEAYLAAPLPAVTLTTTTTAAANKYRYQASIAAPGYMWHKRQNIGKNEAIPDSEKKVDTVGECAAACDGLGGKCVAFSIQAGLRKPGVKRTCWLKDASMITREKKTYDKEWSTYVKSAHHNITFPSDREDTVARVNGRL